MSLFTFLFFLAFENETALPYQGGIEPGSCQGDVNEANDEIPRSIGTRIA
jgi:hypothetical protein